MTLFLARASLACVLALSSPPLLSAEKFSFSADRVESVMAEGRERTLLTGRARVRSGSLNIEAERIELFGKDFKFLECLGKVVAVDDERGIKIETDSLKYDRSRKFSHMEGPSVLEDRENHVMLKALWIENDGQTELTVAQVNVRILKEGLVCRSEYAIYRRADKSLELSGAPSVFRKGDEYKASRIIVNTETEEISLEGEVQGQIISSNGEKGAEKTGPASASPSSSPPLAPPQGSAPGDAAEGRASP